MSSVTKTVKRFRCEPCDKSYKRREALEAHMVTHTGRKPFRCEICKQNFTRKNELSVHTRSQHCDTKPFLCDVQIYGHTKCQKGFTRKSALKRHQAKVHSRSRSEQIPSQIEAIDEAPSHSTLAQVSEVIEILDEAHTAQLAVQQIVSNSASAYAEAEIKWRWIDHDNGTIVFADTGFFHPNERSTWSDKQWLETLGRSNRPLCSAIAWEVPHHLFTTLLENTLDAELVLEITINTKFNALNLAAQKEQWNFYLQKLLQTAANRRNINWSLFQATTALTGGVVYTACRHGNVMGVRLLLEAGVNPQARDKHRDSPLWIAITSDFKDNSKNVELARLLVQHGADVTIRGITDSNLLHVAIGGRRPMLTELIQFGVDIEMCDDEGETPLQLAAREGWMEAVEILVQASANVNARNKRGETALHLAISCADDDDNFNSRSMILNNRSMIVKELVQAHANTEISNSLGKTPLHLAAEVGWVEAVELLAQARTNNNACTSDGETALHLAAVHNEASLTGLLQANADIEISNRDGCTPLHSAALEGTKRAVELLIQAGANVNARNNYGSSVIETAIRWRWLPKIRRLPSGPNTDVACNSDNKPHFPAAAGDLVEIVTLLVKAGANVNVRDQRGATSLHFVASKEYPFNMSTLILTELLQSNVDIDASDDSGNTPLHIAARDGRVELVKLLIEAGANISSVNRFGRTPLEASNKVEVSKILLGAGAEINRRDDFGWTPLMFALNRGNHELTQFLISSGANIHMYTNNGRTAFQIACFESLLDGSSEFRLMQALIDAGVGHDVVDRFGRSPLITFCLLVNLKGFDFTERTSQNINRGLGVLLDGKANPHDTDEDGNGVLHLIGLWLDESMHRRLKSLGVNASARNRFGTTAAEDCLKRLREMTAALTEDLAEISAQATNGNSSGDECDSDCNYDQELAYELMLVQRHVYLLKAIREIYYKRRLRLPSLWDWQEDHGFTVNFQNLI